MNVNLIYDSFDSNGRALPNLDGIGNTTWFDSSNFYSSYLNDGEQGFDYFKTNDKFIVSKHKMDSLLTNPNDMFVYAISHAGMEYHEICNINDNLGLSSRVIKRLKTNKNFYLLYLCEHEADRISGLNRIVDKLNRLGIDHKTFLCTNNSLIHDNLEKVKKIHGYETKVRVHELSFLTYSTYQVLYFENEDFKATSFEWNENKKGKFFMCRNKGAKPHRLALIAFLQSNKEFEKNTNWSYIGKTLYGDVIRKMKPFHTFDFLIENAYNIFKLHEFWKEDDYEAGKNWIDKHGNFIHSGLAPIYLVPELHESFSNSYFNIVTESAFCSEEEVVHVSEKSFRPFFYYQYPIYLTTPFHVKKLREWGFDVFDDMIDHSYDLIENDGDRFKAFIDELLRINKNKNTFIKMYPKLKDRFFKNKEQIKKLAFSKKIEDIEFFKSISNSSELKSNII